MVLVGKIGNAIVPSHIVSGVALIVGLVEAHKLVLLRKSSWCSGIAVRGVGQGVMNCTVYDGQTHIWFSSRRPQEATLQAPLASMQRQSPRIVLFFLRWALPVLATAMPPCGPSLFGARWTAIKTIKLMISFH